MSDQEILDQFLQTGQLPQDNVGDRLGAYFFKPFVRTPSQRGQQVVANQALRQRLLGGEQLLNAGTKNLEHTRWQNSYNRGRIPQLDQQADADAQRRAQREPMQLVSDQVQLAKALELMYGDDPLTGMRAANDAGVVSRMPPLSVGGDGRVQFPRKPPAAQILKLSAGESAQRYNPETGEVTELVAPQYTPRDASQDNTSLGQAQRLAAMTPEEQAAVAAQLKTLGLAHGGVDLAGLMQQLMTGEQGGGGSRSAATTNAIAGAARPAAQPAASGRAPATAVEQALAAKAKAGDAKAQEYLTQKGVSWK